MRRVICRALPPALWFRTANQVVNTALTARCRRLFRQTLGDDFAPRMRRARKIRRALPSFSPCVQTFAAEVRTPAPADVVQKLWKQIEAARVPQAKRPGIGVAVFVLSEKQPESILLGRRKNTIGHGLYQVPGGHLEFGESWEQAAYREVLEETGLHVHNVSLCSIVDTIEPEHDYHYMTIFMRGYVDETRGSEPRNMEPHKCDGWLWWKWSAIPTPDLLFWCLKDFKNKNLNPF